MDFRSFLIPCPNVLYLTGDLQLVKSQKNIKIKPISKLVLFQIGWKKPIILLATTGIGVGVLGEVLILCTALLGRCTDRATFHACAKLTTISFLFCAGE